jgi:hypothetical protein
VIASFHLADVGAWRALRCLRPPKDVPGLRYAEAGYGAALKDKKLGTPQLGRVGMVCSWDDDAALDRFLESDPAAARLGDCFHVRLAPLRISGAWSGFPELQGFEEQPVDDEEPVAVVTLGRLIYRQGPRFFSTNAPAAGMADKDPAIVLSTALARPSFRFLATFSLWRSAGEMKSFAYGKAGPGHLNAIRAQNAKAFHRESAFIRFRPYAAVGTVGNKEFDIAR